MQWPISEKPSRLGMACNLDTRVDTSIWKPTARIRTIKDIDRSGVVCSVKCGEGWEVEPGLSHTHTHSHTLLLLPRPRVAAAARAGNSLKSQGNCQFWSTRQSASLYHHRQTGGEWMPFYSCLSEQHTQPGSIRTWTRVNPFHKAK